MQLFQYAVALLGTISIGRAIIDDATAINNESKIIYVTLDYKTSYRGQLFLELRFININKLSIDVWFVRIGQCLAEIQLLKSK